jgi:hypothetical protein
MSEAGANGATQTAIDYTATKAELSSASTSRRIAQLKTLDEKINSKSRLPCSNSNLIAVLLFTYAC